MRQSIYIDTCILIGYVEKGRNDINRTAKENVRKIQSMVRHNSEIKVKIPTTILGEFMLWCIRNDDCDNRALSDFKMLVKNLNADFPAPQKEHYELARKLMETDDRFEPNDALIISYALLDPTTTWFLTTDTNLHNNRIIEEEKDKRNNKFKISDRI